MRTDKLTVGLVGILMVIGAVAILQQRETNAQLRRQMADLYRKSGHTAIAGTGDSASAGTIAVSKEGYQFRRTSDGWRLVVPGKAVDKLGKKLSDPPKK
jgi:hypothetical protein